MRAIAFLPLLLVAILSCSRPVHEGVRHEDAVRPKSLRFIGEQIIDSTLMVGGTRVGGLSGIDRAPDGTYYIICDDRSQINPARFYTASIDLDAGGLGAVTLTGTAPLRMPDGGAFPGRGESERNVVDPESIRYDAAGDRLIWTSEGERGRMIDPMIIEMRRDGSFIREIPLPSIFRMSREEKGPRENGVFEGLALSADGEEVVVALEDALHEDGESATLTAGAPVRITRIHRKSGRVLAQYAYMLDKIPAEPVPPTAGAGNGVSEILAIDSTTLLVVERSFSSGVGNSVRIYLADFSQASDITEIPSLVDASYRPARKRLLLDLGRSGLKRLDNIEGITWGPTLPNGHRTLLLVSDNNFNPRQVTQVVAVEVIGIDD